jgi:hypothetical protein
MSLRACLCVCVCVCVCDALEYKGEEYRARSIKTRAKSIIRSKT